MRRTPGALGQLVTFQKAEQELTRPISSMIAQWSGSSGMGERMSRKPNFDVLIVTMGTAEETQNNLRDSSATSHWKWIHRNTEENNEGFIVPNNRLYKRSASDCPSPYVLLLNDDVILKPGWDVVLLAEMLHDDRLGAVGFSGGMLGPDGVGCAGASGYEVDYIEGWCLLLRRSAVDAVAEGGPLFNEQRQRFAYAEDSELCLRLRRGGWNILALPNPGERFATHLRGRTTQRLR